MYRVHIIFMFALLQKMRTKKISVGSCAVRFTDEDKAKNVPRFASKVHKSGTFYLQNTAKSVRILLWLALLTYVSSL